MTTIQRVRGGIVALLAGALGVLATAPVAAQVDEELPPALQSEEDDERPWSTSRPERVLPDQPARLFFQVGAGAGLRVVENLDFSQERFGPAFLDAFGAFILPGAEVRHGIGINISTNLSGDGDFVFGVNPFEQLALGPSYLILLDISRDLSVHGKVGVPFTIRPDFVPGAELGVGGAFYFLAGLGLYAELAGVLFFGGENNEGQQSYHPLVTGEAGIQIDYELLP